MENNNYLCIDNNNESKESMNFKATFARYGHTISSMAEAMGLSQQSLSRQIIQGTINIKQLEQMAQICGVSLAEFVGADVADEIVIKSNGHEYVYKLKK